MKAKSSSRTKLTSRQKEKLKREKWIAKRQLKSPSASKKSLLAEYKEYRSRQLSPDHQAHLAKRRERYRIKKETSAKENQLRHFKRQQEIANQYYPDASELPTEREIKFDRFLEGLDRLPPEIRNEYVSVFDYMRRQYGDETIAYYLERRDLFAEVTRQSKMNYKIYVAERYLSDLALFAKNVMLGEIDSTGNAMQTDEPWLQHKATPNKTEERPDIESLIKSTNIFFESADMEEYEYY